MGTRRNFRSGGRGEQAQKFAPTWEKRPPIWRKKVAKRLPRGEKGITEGEKVERKPPYSGKGPP